VTRAIIDVKDIRKALILENDVGYVRIAEFREDTAKDLAKALGDLSGQGMKGLIVDLRSNPGGLLDSAVDVASLFIEPKKLVVYTLDRDGKKEDFMSTDQAKAQRDIPMVVMVDDGSASGSEIVSGCMQDYQRAVVLGVTSYGKASVQTVIPLSDGSALRLTTAKYYTPNGRLIHEKGITPDIVVESKRLELDKPSKEDEVFAKAEQLENGKPDAAVSSSKKDDTDSDEKDDPLFYKRDAQLVRAVDLVRGMIIVGRR
jgi:carboxyl-terminal processing protease